MKVKVKKFSDAAILPCYAHDGEDATMDLYCVDYEYDQYNNIVYKTGIGFEIPTGYVGLLFPRSSNCKTDLLLTNSVGLVDSGFRGEIILKYKIVDKDGNYILKHEIGERVGQIMIMPYPHIELDLVDELSESNRGVGGFGSTGK
jgi:dUTP pyrophosphatase